VNDREQSLDRNPPIVCLAVERLNPFSRLPAICWQGNEFSKALHNGTLRQVHFEAGEAEKFSVLPFLSFQRKTESRVKRGRLNTGVV